MKYWVALPFPESPQIPSQTTIICLICYLWCNILQGMYMITSKFMKLDTETKAYWLGFLFADGCLVEYVPSYYRISVCLSAKDGKHL